eukprot:3986590-Amphidinium_carterae.1
MISTKTRAHAAITENALLTKVLLNGSWKTEIASVYTDRDLGPLTQAAVEVGYDQCSSLEKSLNRVKTFLP